MGFAELMLEDDFCSELPEYSRNEYYSAWNEYISEFDN